MAEVNIEIASHVTFTSNDKSFVQTEKLQHRHLNQILHSLLHWGNTDAAEGSQPFTQTISQIWNQDVFKPETDQTIYCFAL